MLRLAVEPYATYSVVDVIRSATLAADLFDIGVDITVVSLFIHE